MGIPLQQARALLSDLRSGRAATLFAQAHAKHVLHEVDEDLANFPDFDRDLDDKVTFAAYGILSAGCSLLEADDRAEGSKALEQAASLLQHVHGSAHAGEARASGFHVFVAGLAFYAAGHYSRAFIAVRAVEQQTPAGRVVAAFLAKDVRTLVRALNDIFLGEPIEFNEQGELDEWAITVGIARAIATTLEFALAGQQNGLAEAYEHLRPAAAIAVSGRHPAWWWIVRLLRLMLRDLERASPWNVLPPYFGAEHSAELDRYVRLQAHAKRSPLFELWTSQRGALPLALDRAKRGGVINLRTSGGKTRVAELAILQTLVDDPNARILYLAPFRSLALEVEHTLSATFSWLGHSVSHLYGGSRVSSVDTELAAESSIMIATPEKTRALFRAAPELFENVKLVVVDEGHLIGADPRHVRNELFLDHLRALARSTGARLLLLSAVLPNAKDLAEWVTGDPEAVATSPWKPSVERFGLLRWNGSRVRIDWQGEVASFNPSFVEAAPLEFGSRRRAFPATKNEAVAATAVRLSAIGPVMIFTARASSVANLAEAVLLALGREPVAHPWPVHEWRVFEAVCREELEPDAVEVRAARAGVICHSNRLTPQVRLAIEHLMRAKAPRIIVATTTLAQGVNVGVSSVIVANPYISAKTIDKRTFWNICGRAGRAFVDGEGKILYAIDTTRTAAQIRRDERLAREYFDAGTGDPVQSGLLLAVAALRRLARSASVSFDLLLQLAAENDFSRLGSGALECDAVCDQIDDELLALHEDALANAGAAAPAAWVEHVFRGSLAALQAREPSFGVSPDDVLAFLRARADSALRRVSSGVRRAVVSSGLPLRIALRAQEHLDAFRRVADTLTDENEESVATVTSAVKVLERWARAHAAAIVGTGPETGVLNSIREGWLAGRGLHELGSSDEVMSAIRDFYGYQLPWIIHAASQQLRAAEETERADALTKIALLVELGVPTQLAARVFLAGVRSRTAATQLASTGFAFGATVAEIARQLRARETADDLRAQLSPDTANWLDLLGEEASRARGAPAPSFRRFRVTSVDAGGAVLLHARSLGNAVFLCSTDGRTRIPVKSTGALPFREVMDDPRFAFARDGDGWRLVVRDPRLDGGDGGRGI